MCLAWPFRLLDYGSTMLRCKISHLATLPTDLEDYMSEGGRMKARKRLHREGIAKNMSERVRNLVMERLGYGRNSGRYFRMGGEGGPCYVMCEECDETTQSMLRFSSKRRRTKLLMMLSPRH